MLIDVGRRSRQRSGGHLARHGLRLPILSRILLKPSIWGLRLMKRCSVTELGVFRCRHASRGVILIRAARCLSDAAMERKTLFKLSRALL